jgi:hypothetical protein
MLLSLSLSSSWVLLEEVEEVVLQFVYKADYHREQYRCDPPSPSQMVRCAT